MIGPCPELLLKTYRLEVGPTVVGWKVTVCFKKVPGSIVVPSGIGTTEENAPLGAMARVMMSATVPLLPTLKVTCAVPPTGTDPASTEALETARCSTPVTAAPLTGMVTEPWLVETDRAEGYEPATAGSKFTDAVTDCW